MLYFDGQVREGRLKLYDEDQFREYVRKFEGKGVRLSLEKGNKRSSQQNKWLWGVAYKLLSEHTGHTAWELHEYCKRECNPVPVEITNKNTGETKTHIVGKSTTELSTVEFGEYMEFVQRLAAELGCIIPDPNENAQL